MGRRYIYMVVVTLLATAIFSSQAQASTKKEIRKFNKFVKVLDKEYIDDLDYNYLIEVAIRAILDQTDPYSTYLVCDDNEEIITAIDSPSIDTTYMIDGSTSVIKLGLFGHDASGDIERAYREVGSPENLILDLRGNKGGLVTEAVKVSNLFLKQGESIFRRDRANRPAVTHTAKYDGDMLSTNLIIVIDKQSASASEIVASAMQFNKRALIVGQRSFGKGLIISPFPLQDGSVMWIATAQYTTPNGGKIQRSYRGRESSDSDGGVTPDLKYEGNELIDIEDFIIFSQFSR